MKKFIDSSTAPIIAWDFDGTLNVGGESIYPLCGEPRKYAKEVLGFLHSVGVKNIIWTSRDVSIDQETLMVHDDITDAIRFLDYNSIPYDAINKSVQFAPYKYNSRKVYAHMYVDDRAYGWQDHEFVLLHVLEDFLSNILDVGYFTCTNIYVALTNGKEVPEDDINTVRAIVNDWNK